MSSGPVGKAPGTTRGHPGPPGTTGGHRDFDVHASDVHRVGRRVTAAEATPAVALAHDVRSSRRARGVPDRGTATSADAGGAAGGTPRRPSSDIAPPRPARYERRALPTRDGRARAPRAS